MRKRFVLKTYTLAGVYQKTFNPQDLMGDISFSDKIGGGQGECTITLNLKIDDFGEGTDVDYMNIIKVYESDDVYSPEPRLIYTGFVSQYTPYFNEGSEGVKLTLLGLISLLSFDYYQVGGAYSFTVNNDPADVIKNIVDDFQTRASYDWILRDAGQIDTVGTVVNYDFADIKWYDAIKKMAEFTDEDWWWHVAEDGQVWLKDRPATATHILTLGKDVESGEIKKNTEKIINKYRLTWGTVPTISTYQNATSQTDYFIRGKNETDSEINNMTTADQQGDKYLADYKDPRVEARIRVNTQYDIESIKVGHTITIRNAKKGSTVFPDNMQVTALQYDPNGVTLTLENEIPSLADTFVSAVEAII